MLAVQKKKHFWVEQAGEVDIKSAKRRHDKDCMSNFSHYLHKDSQLNIYITKLLCR